VGVSLPNVDLLEESDRITIRREVMPFRILNIESQLVF
jgi:hypothetical protein